MARRSSVAQQLPDIQSLRRAILGRRSASRDEQLRLLSHCKGVEDCITALCTWLVSEAGVSPRDVIREIKLTKSGQARPGVLSAVRKRHDLLIAASKSAR